MDFRQFKDAFTRGNAAVAKRLWKTIWTKCVNLDSNVAGSLHLDFARRIRLVISEIQKNYKMNVASGPDLEEVDFSENGRKIWGLIINHLGKVTEACMLEARKSLGKKDSLESYSSYLANFDARSSWHGSVDEWLEVPGQYVGLERPEPAAHVRIMRFASQVL